MFSVLRLLCTLVTMSIIEPGFTRLTYQRYRTHTQRQRTSGGKFVVQLGRVYQSRKKAKKGGHTHTEADGRRMM